MSSSPVETWEWRPGGTSAGAKWIVEDVPLDLSRAVTMVAQVWARFPVPPETKNKCWGELSLCALDRIGHGGGYATLAFDSFSHGSGQQDDVSVTGALRVSAPMGTSARVGVRLRSRYWSNDRGVRYCDQSYCDEDHSGIRAEDVVVRSLIRTL